MADMVNIPDIYFKLRTCGRMTDGGEFIETGTQVDQPSRSRV